MIQLNELRIGNWVIEQCDSNYSRLNKVWEIESKREGDGYRVNCTEPSQLYPIPLTPEILEKVGFGWSIYHQAYHKTGFIFDLSDRHVGGYYMHMSKSNNIIYPEILYLHQLQNLYFALTGEELQIEL